VNGIIDGVGGLILPIVRYFRIICMLAYIAINVDIRMKGLTYRVRRLILPIVRYFRIICMLACIAINVDTLMNRRSGWYDTADCPVLPIYMYIQPLF
jgi:hypothetical protein